MESIKVTFLYLFFDPEQCDLQIDANDVILSMPKIVGTQFLWFSQDYDSSLYSLCYVIGHLVLR